MSEPQDTTATVVLLDDDHTSSLALLRRLEREEPAFRFIHLAHPDKLSATLEQHTPEVVIVDLELIPEEGPQSGLGCIESIAGRDPTIRILALTGHAASTYGLEALARGAASFLEKPADLQHLLALIRDGVTFSRLYRQLISIKQSQADHDIQVGLTTRCEVMRKALQQATYAAHNSIPVLLLGETGTGKGVLARAIHQHSSRRNRHFIRLQPHFGNQELVASELFGHTKGAFTGAISARRGLLEEAHQGTLFLDEVDQLPQETQIALLEALQERTFRPLGGNKEVKSDFRLLSATNKPEKELIHQNALRADFFHRVSQIRITLPPLRERIEDIPDLARKFLTLIIEREELPVHGITAEALHWLSRQDWPGNIRQLQGVVERAAHQASFNQKSLIDLEELRAEDITKPFERASVAPPGSFRQQVQDFELKLLEEALARCENNQSKAAESLQLERSTFRRILARRIAK